MPIPQSARSFALLRRSGKRLAVLGVALLGLAAVTTGGVWWSQGTGAIATAGANSIGGEAPGGKGDGEPSDRAPSLIPAGPGKESETNPVARSGTTTPPEPPQPDPFKRVLDAQGNTPLSKQPMPTDRQAPQDPFKQALEESNRQKAAAAVSPFGTSK